MSLLETSIAMLRARLKQAMVLCTVRIVITILSCVAEKLEVPHRNAPCSWDLACIYFPPSAIGVCTPDDAKSPVVSGMGIFRSAHW